MGQTRNEKVFFNVQRKELGGIVNPKFDNPKQQKSSQKYYTVPLMDIFDRNNVPRMVDYMSLDIEGAEYYAMEKFDFDKYIVRILTIERPEKSLRQLLQRKGYELLRIVSDFGETLWAHSSIVNQLDLEALDKFKLPDLDPKKIDEMNFQQLPDNYKEKN